MQVAYITRKVFADDSEEIRIKQNKYITRKIIEQGLKTKIKNKIERKLRNQRLCDEINKLNLFDPNYAHKSRILIKELKLRNIQNVNRSAHRSRQALYDICRCNDFQYFVTWTFDSDKIERLNDTIVKRKFTQFQNYLRKKFPNMYYIAVPEYHKKGGLHFHLLIGGVTMDELKAVPAKYEKRKGRHKKGDLIFKNGHQIFNVSRWKLGYSTLSVIGNGEATKHYICKYISKQHLDDRFFGKRRYYVSKNIRRPEVYKYCKATENSFDGIDLNVYTVAYADKSKKYAVFTHDGNGVVDYARNTDEVKRHISELAEPLGASGNAAAPTECADGTAGAISLRAPAAPSGGCPYLTLRTLDSNFYPEGKETVLHLSNSPLWIYALDEIRS